MAGEMISGVLIGASVGLLAVAFWVIAPEVRATIRHRHRERLRQKREVR